MVVRVKKKSFRKLIWVKKWLLLHGWQYHWIHKMPRNVEIKGQQINKVIGVHAL